MVLQIGVVLFLKIKTKQKKKEKLEPKENTKLEQFCLYAVKVIPKAGSIPELVPKGLGTMRQLHHG